MADKQLAAETTVVPSPYLDDPNAGVIVAAGDPLPEGALGYTQNTPNTVDAAANADVADAADQAADAPGPRVVNEWGSVGAGGEGTGYTEPDASSGPADGSAPGSFAEMTVKQLDEYAAGREVEGYEGNKADKVAALEAAYPDGPAGDEED